MSEADAMTCAQLAEVAAELALGGLTGRERALAVAHLQECAGCREDVRQLMAAGGQLVELLPQAEPPAGFESRVLARLGLATAAGEAPAGGGSRLLPRPDGAPRRWRPAKRARRALAAGVVGLAVITAGLGGWLVGAAAGPGSAGGASQAGSAGGGHPANGQRELTSAGLVSATGRQVGDLFLYAGPPRWLYMQVALGSVGNETVTCQVIGADGRATTIGSFRLSGGHGSWGSQAPVSAGSLTGARVVSADGTVLATASFTAW